MNHFSQEIISALLQNPTWALKQKNIINQFTHMDAQQCKGNTFDKPVLWEEEKRREDGQQQEAISPQVVFNKISTLHCGLKQNDNRNNQ